MEQRRMLRFIVWHWVNNGGERHLIGWSWVLLSFGSDLFPMLLLLWTDQRVVG